MANGESYQMVDPLRHQRPGRPCESGPPIVANKVRPLDTEMVQYPEDVANEGGDSVLLDPFRLVGGAEAAKVGDDYLEPSPGQRRHLLAPQPPRVREAVEQDYGLAFSSYLDLDTYPIDIYAHVVSPSTHNP